MAGLAWTEGAAEAEEVEDIVPGEIESVTHTHHTASPALIYGSRQPPSTQAVSIFRVSGVRCATPSRTQFQQKMKLVAKHAWLSTFTTLLVCSFARGTLSGAFSITVTPWCDHSFRVRVMPTAHADHTRHAHERLQATLSSHGLAELPGALVGDHCHPGGRTPLPAGGSAKSGNLQVSLTQDGQSLGFTRVDTGAALFSANPSFATSSVEPGYLASSLVTMPGDKDELIYGPRAGQLVGPKANGLVRRGRGAASPTSEERAGG